MDEGSGGILTDSFVAIVVEVEGLVGRDVFEGTEDEPSDALVGKFEGLYVLEVGRLFLGVVDSRDEDR